METWIRKYFNEINPTNNMRLANKDYIKLNILSITLMTFVQIFHLSATFAFLSYKKVLLTFSKIETLRMVNILFEMRHKNQYLSISISHNQLFLTYLALAVDICF